ncbi:hypothetical protein VTH8203_00630 [Vibrio thalassae]|uniref:Fimbrial assembly protein FimA n=1 Tax=Vibrio thalassae TaxID=1243014 RepID=A0A240EFS6_9VIBR|nr:DUF1028 domain-containing protein [Vibrio thalassae]SNX47029.1 hypothetical protein VTH8203_00630 [Vibrio thalassae]
MTYSLLLKDEESNAICGVAATGNLCVGGWVLRAQAGIGISASQGHSPSTFWGEEALALMNKGQGPHEVVHGLVGPDAGREYRQLSVVNSAGVTSVFTGRKNGDYHGSIQFDNGVACGNLLAGKAVLTDIVDFVNTSSLPLIPKLITSLEIGENQGGDIRGLQSAALLVVKPDAPPLSLRIDYSERPIKALMALYSRVTTQEYQEFLNSVPTLNKMDRY